MSYISGAYATHADELSNYLPIDPDQIVDLVSNIVFVNSVVNVVKALGFQEHLDGLLSSLRDMVGTFIVALAVENTYVEGLASLLSTMVGHRLWDIELSEEELADFLSMLVGYRVSLSRGELDGESSLELINMTCYYLRIVRCEELISFVKPLTPAIALQVALTGLAVSVGGVGG